MTEEEEKAIWYFGEVLVDENDMEHWKIVENLIDKLQKELEEKTTILMAGADKVKQLEKENQELKEELDYYKQKENQDFDERDYYEE